MKDAEEGACGHLSPCVGTDPIPDGGLYRSAVGERWGWAREAVSVGEWKKLAVSVLKDNVL